MSGAFCERYPACHEITNSPQPPKCDKLDCPGRPTFAPMETSAACKFCFDSKIEFVAAGHGNVLEIPCSICCAPDRPLTASYRDGATDV